MHCCLRCCPLPRLRLAALACTAQASRQLGCCLSKHTHPTSAAMVRPPVPPQECDAEIAAATKERDALEGRKTDLVVEKKKLGNK